MESLADEIVLLVVQLYLAAVLGVSGLAKLDSIAHFAATLDRYRLLPSWSIAPLAWITPIAEVAVAASLVLGTAAVATGLSAVVLFCGFLVLRIVLLTTKRVVDCGCHGRFYHEVVDGASIVVSIVLLLLAAFNLSAVWGGASVDAILRLPSVLGYAGVLAWILRGMLKRHRIHGRHRAYTSASAKV